jgi:hypothetical protein
MNKLKLVVVSCLFFFITSCDDEKVIGGNDLPQAAQTFISTHFPGESITRAVKDTEGKTEYDVRLSNGFKLEFNSAGEWREIEGFGIEIPLTIQDELPPSILAYVSDNHSAQLITKLEIDRGNYEVYLIGGLEIVFSSTGDFIRYDD